MSIIVYPTANPEIANQQQVGGPRVFSLIILRFPHPTVAHARFSKAESSLMWPLPCHDYNTSSQIFDTIRFHKSWIYIYLVNLLLVVVDPSAQIIQLCRQ